LVVKSGYISEVFVSFQGEGAYVGQRHLFVRLAGCNLRCRYCDTPDSLERTDTYTVFTGQQPETRSNPVSAQDLASLIAALLRAEGGIDAIAITGGEPLAQSDFLVAVLDAGRFALPVLLETNGVLPHRLRQVLPLIQIVSMDIKLPSNTDEGAWWEEHAEFLQLARTKDLYVKLLVDQTTTDEDVQQAVALLVPIEPRIPTFMQPIVDASLRPSISIDRLTELYLVAHRQLSSVRVLPQTHKLFGIR
jgi:7-carboxy-7-deazaguanine synthase